MKIVHAPGNKEWEVDYVIQWTPHSYGFEVESEEQVGINFGVYAVIALLFLFIWVQAPDGVPPFLHLFLAAIFISPAFIWVSSRHRLVRAANGSEYWQETVRGRKNAKELVKQVVKTLKATGQPTELDRVY